MDNTSISLSVDGLIVKQLNLHHSKGATALIDSSLREGQTAPSRTIVLVQEPWVNGNKIVGLNPQHYNIFEPPATGKVRTCVLASKSINATLMPQFCCGDATTVLVTAGTKSNTQRIIFCSGYFPSEEMEMIPCNEIRNLFSYAHSVNIPIIIGCDANAHHVLWGSENTNARGMKLVEYIATTNLELINRGSTPTFLSANCATIIDLTLASPSISGKISNWKVSTEETLSDHREINFLVHHQASNEPIYRNPRATNWEKFRTQGCESIANRAWVADPETIEVLDESVNSLTEILQEAFNDNCPMKRANSKGKSWCSTNLSALRTACRKLFRSYKWHTGNDKSSKWEAYKAKRNEYQAEIALAKRTAWHKFCDGINDVPATAKIHKLLSKDTPSSVGFLKKPSGDFTCTHEETASLLLDTHFPGNLKPEVAIQTPQVTDHSPWNDVVVNNIVTEEKVLWAINSFLPYKSPGRDGIYPKMLQTLGEVIAPRLCSIYKAALRLGYTSKAW